MLLIQNITFHHDSIKDAILNLCCPFSQLSRLTSGFCARLTLIEIKQFKWTSLLDFSRCYGIHTVSIACDAVMTQYNCYES